MTSVALVAGNTSPALSVTLRNNTGTQNLTGAAVAVRLTNVETREVVGMSAAIQVPATDGRIAVPPPAEGWPEGTWMIEYDVTFDGGAMQTFPLRAEDIDHLIIRAIIEPAP